MLQITIFCRKFALLLSFIVLCGFANCETSRASDPSDVHLGQTKESALDSIGTHHNVTSNPEDVDSFQIASQDSLPVEFLGFANYDIDGLPGGFSVYLDQRGVFFTVWSARYDSLSGGDAHYQQLCDYYKSKFGDPVRKQSFITPFAYSSMSFRDGGEDIGVSIIAHQRVSVDKFYDNSPPVFGNPGSGMPVAAAYATTKEVHLGQSQESALSTVRAHPNVEQDSSVNDKFKMYTKEGQPVRLLAFTGYDLDAEQG